MTEDDFTGTNPTSISLGFSEKDLLPFERRKRKKRNPCFFISDFHRRIKTTLYTILKKKSHISDFYSLFFLSSFVTDSPSFAISREPGFGFPIREGIPVSLKCDVDSNPPSSPVWQKGKFSFVYFFFNVKKKDSHRNEYFR